MFLEESDTDIGRYGSGTDECQLTESSSEENLVSLRTRQKVLLIRFLPEGENIAVVFNKAVFDFSGRSRCLLGEMAVLYRRVNCQTFEGVDKLIRIKLPGHRHRSLVLVNGIGTSFC